MPGSFELKTQSGTASGNTTQTLGVTYLARERPVILAIFRGDSAGADPTLTLADGGTHTYTLLGSLYIRANTDLACAFFETTARSAVAGGFTVTATYSETCTFRYLAHFRGLLLDTNAAQDTKGQDQNPVAAGPDAVTSTNLTPTSQPNTLLAITFSRFNTSAVAASAGFNDLGALTTYDPLNSDSSRAAWKNTSSTSPVAGTFTPSVSDSWLTLAAMFGDQTVFPASQQEGSAERARYRRRYGM